MSPPTHTCPFAPLHPLAYRHIRFRIFPSPQTHSHSHTHLLPMNLKEQLQTIQSSFSCVSEFEMERELRQGSAIHATVSLFFFFFFFRSHTLWAQARSSPSLAHHFLQSCSKESLLHADSRCACETCMPENALSFPQALIADLFPCLIGPEFHAIAVID